MRGVAGDENRLRESEVRFVEAGGLRLRALLDGPVSAERTPVVLLHGFTGNASTMACASAPLAEDRRVVRLELVGHGESDAPKDVAPYAMEACTDQVAEAVEALELERPALVGYSMGGRAALATAIRHPEAFSSLVLVGATAGIEDPVLRQQRIRDDEALADRIERDGLESFVEKWMALPIFASQRRLGEEALSAARAQRLRNRPHGLANSLRGMGAGAQPPLFDALDRFPGPVLLVVGEEDEKFRGIAAGLEQGLLDARTEILGDAGHAAHLEAPETFARVLRRFLASRDPGWRAQSRSRAGGSSVATDGQEGGAE